MNNKGIIFSIGVTTILLFGLGIAGTIRTEKIVRERQFKQAENLSKAQTKVSSNSSLSSEDKEMYDQLWNLLSKGELEEAAKQINNHKMTGKTFPCIYNGTDLKEMFFSGRVLVLTKPSTVFFGNFADGKPEGQCIALQVLALDEGRRYDYSVGMWKDGKMNGDCVCGYDYYEGITGDTPKKIVKKGNFINDLMQGEITYTSTNAAGEVATWHFQVEQGVIVPDDRWIKDTDSSGVVSYQLMAKEDDVHAYILSEQAMNDDRWRNLILYVPTF